VFGGAELPVLERTVVELARIREDIDRVSTQQLADIVMHDPIMTHFWSISQSRRPYRRGLPMILLRSKGR
jgi:hypothetical protein